MAENIYSKGTRVWFTDKEQGWISAEVTNVVKGSDDKIKLAFIDDRGKVSAARLFFYHRQNLSLPWLEPLFQEIAIDTTAKAIREGQDDLPPLRNPPLLETADDLATLSHLNEPSGAFLPSRSFLHS
jgi:myosin-5